jgi:glycosyltransferase involved in cell wall biosynthesis
MQKLRIAVLSPIHWRTPPRKQGAWELVASNITEELVKRGHDVTLFATGDSVTKAKLKWVAPHAIFNPADKLESKVYGYMHAAMPFELADQFDIIHNHFDGYPLVFSRLIKTPVVTTVHGFSSPQIKDLYLRYNQSAYVSISMADRKRCPEMNWVANIHHGINLDELPFSPRAQDYFAFLGRVHPTKGTHLAIRAAKQAGAKLKLGVHIDENDPVVVGYWRDECLPFIDGKQIINLGEVGPAARSELLRGAIAMLFPIQWEEPFGLVLIESMASGTPVVAFGRGSAPEVVKDGVGGLVVEPDNLDAMVTAMQKVSELDRQAVRSYAEANFTVGRMVEQYEQVYERLVR